MDFFSLLFHVKLALQMEFFIFELNKRLGRYREGVDANYNATETYHGTLSVMPSS